MMDQWYCAISGKQYGPVSEEDLLRWRSEGRLTDADMVWQEGMAQWQALGSVAGLEDAGRVPGTPPSMPPPQRPPTPHRGVTILVLGIMGLVSCGICGIIAWVMASHDIEEMQAGRMDPAGRSMTDAGRTCGMITSILAIAVVSIYFLLFFMFAGLSVAIW
jgi:hypothetical protein